MATRHQESKGPLSQNRYMSSPEFAELRGVNGVAVAARAAVVVGKQKKEFLWWLQSESLKEGGFKRLANELLEMFPERIGTPDMHRQKVRAEKTYPGELAKSVAEALSNSAFYCYDPDNPSHQQPQSGADLILKCRDAALRRHDFYKSQSDYVLDREVHSIEEFLIDLCINPRVYFSAPGEETDFSQLEAQEAMDKHPELQKYDFTVAALPYFKDIIGALFEYKSRSEQTVRESFCFTSIGQTIWETLDFGLNRRRMVLIDGLEGRGKTEAVKAWCAAHGGLARFVSLKGITSKTTAFRQVAKALGVASSYTRNASEMMERAQDVLKLSKLMLVIDEAHFAFSQSNRVSYRPELIDWIDTALCNEGVPTALITTPQFLICMTRAADKVGWNYRQFRRRVARWRKLPDQNTESDIKGVARRVFVNAKKQMISKIAGYALLSKRDLSAIGDVADEVRAMLGHEDLSKATSNQIYRAIHEILLPGDEAFLKGMATARKAIKAHCSIPQALNPQIVEPDPEPSEVSRKCVSTDIPTALSRRGNITELVQG